MSAQHIKELAEAARMMPWDTAKTDVPFDARYAFQQAITADHYLQLLSQRDELLAALIEANEFIDGIRQDLQHERIADWYPEGAHNSAEAMSESMRLIANRCADFDSADAAIAKATGSAA